MTPSVRLSKRAARADAQPIGELMAQALARPRLISLAAGFVDQHTLPVEAARLAFDDVLGDETAARAALQYGATAGYAPLRERLLAMYLEAEGMSAAASGLSVEQTLITAGSNQLLHLLAEALLDPGDVVLCAAPSYLVALGLFANLGARAVGVSSDEHGLSPEALDKTFARWHARGQLERIKAVYLVPEFNNPDGACLAAERRAAVVSCVKRWSRRQRVYVIEDAAYRELRYAGEHLPSLRRFDAEGDTVIVCGTFSKSFAPGVRVGWGFLPRALVEPVLLLKGNIDFGAPNLAQHLMFRVLERGLYRPHVERLRAGYRLKLEAMLAAADQHLAPLEGVRWRRPQGGLYVWLELPPGVDAGPRGTLLAAALEEGVLYVPGEYCFPGKGAARRTNTIRLSFGVQTAEGVRRGVEMLSRALARQVPRAAERAPT